MGRYVRGLDSRQMIPGIKEELLRETPVGIVVDADGLPAKDAGKVLDDMLSRKGGGLLPLGGLSELFGGTKAMVLL